MDYFYSLISIHFLYTEEDQVKHEQKEFITISIHFLYTEEDVAIRGRIVRQRNFNPLPLYRGRPEAEAGNQGLIGISIHFLYTEEDNTKVFKMSDRTISIHFLYTEEDYHLRNQRR